MDVAEHAVTGRRLELGVAAEDLDVGAEARQGGAQLVAGVLGEPLLLFPRATQCVEHRREAVREPAGLVRATLGHVDVETTALGDRLGGRRQAGHGSRDPRRDPPTDQRRQHRYRSTDDGEADPQVGQDVLHLVELAAQLDRAAARQCDRQDPVVGHRAERRPGPRAASSTSFESMGSGSADDAAYRTPDRSRHWTAVPGRSAIGPPLPSSGTFVLEPAADLGGVAAVGVGEARRSSCSSERSISW